MEISETQMRYIVGEALDEKLKPIHHRLDNIDTKLHNHLEHTAMNIGGIKSDIAWLKDFTQKGGQTAQPKSGKDDPEDAKQGANIEWLTWGFRLIVGGLITNAIAIVVIAIKMFVK